MQKLEAQPSEAVGQMPTTRIHSKKASLSLKKLVK